MNSVISDSPVILTTDNWMIRDILCKRDAIIYGKDRGWCTADPDNPYYDNYYTKDRGDLYIIYKLSRKRPYAQLFIDNQNKSMEFRRANNNYIDVHEFVAEVLELKDWFLSVGYVKEVGGSKYTRVQNTSGSQISSFEASSNNFDGSMDIRLTSHSTVNSVTNIAELPDIADTPDGTMFLCLDESCMYMSVDGRYERMDNSSIETNDPTYDRVTALIGNGIQEEFIGRATTSYEVTGTVDHSVATSISEMIYRGVTNGNN